MKYRQWKKNYKKLHGVNPPLELDKRKQRRLAKKTIKQMNIVSIAEVANRAAAAITNGLAIEIRGRVFSWQVREYGSSHYAVYEINALGGADELRAITYSQTAAEKIAEILESDHLEHTRQTSPDRIQRRNDAADGLRAAVITAYESGVLK